MKKREKYLPPRSNSQEDIVNKSQLLPAEERKEWGNSAYIHPYMREVKANDYYSGNLMNLPAYSRFVVCYLEVASKQTIPHYLLALLMTTVGHTS